MTMTRVKLVTMAIGFAALGAAASCGGGVEGTYSDPNGTIKLELKGGGKAAMTFMTQTQECTYTTDKKKIALDCKDGTPLELTQSDDGKTLQMPPGSLIPTLTKK